MIQPRQVKYKTAVGARRVAPADARRYPCFIMPVCASSLFCIILLYLQAGAYIAIMLAVLGVPQMLTYYLERRDRRRREQGESRAEADHRHQESRAEAERRYQERRAESERRHQETIAIISGLIAALAGDRQPAPDHSQAIANLQQAVTELTSQVAQLSERIQNGNGSNRPGNQHDD